MHIALPLKPLGAGMENNVVLTPIENWKGIIYCWIFQKWNDVKNEMKCQKWWQLNWNCTNTCNI